MSKVKAGGREYWAAEVRELLVGRTITAVRYMSSEEMDELGWYRSGIVLTLDNGLSLFPSRDDEGNDAGALFTTSEEMPTIPVIG